jgi:hypothetical protein
MVAASLRPAVGFAAMNLSASWLCVGDSGATAATLVKFVARGKAVAGRRGARR